MEMAERRDAIMQLLYRRRFETINNLSSEFGVSRRTIRRDIEVLSKTEPIYTQSGRYGGGIYVLEGYLGLGGRLNQKEIKLFHKLYQLAQNQQICELTKNELLILKGVLERYPLMKGGESNETARAGSF